MSEQTFIATVATCLAWMIGLAIHSAVKSRREAIDNEIDNLRDYVKDELRKAREKRSSMDFRLNCLEIWREECKRTTSEQSVEHSVSQCSG